MAASHRGHSSVGRKMPYHELDCAAGMWRHRNAAPRILCPSSAARNQSTTVNGYLTKGHNLNEGPHYRHRRVIEADHCHNHCHNHIPPLPTSRDHGPRASRCSLLSALQRFRIIVDIPGPRADPTPIGVQTCAHRTACKPVLPWRYWFAPGALVRTKMLPLSPREMRMLSPLDPSTSHTMPVSR